MLLLSPLNHHWPITTMTLLFSYILFLVWSFFHTRVFLISIRIQPDQPQPQIPTDTLSRTSKSPACQARSSYTSSRARTRCLCFFHALACLLICLSRCSVIMVYTTYVLAVVEVLANSASASAENVHWLLSGLPQLCAAISASLVLLSDVSPTAPSNPSVLLTSALVLAGSKLWLPNSPLFLSILLRFRQVLGSFWPSKSTGVLCFCHLWFYKVPSSYLVITCASLSRLKLAPIGLAS